MRPERASRTSSVTRPARPLKGTPPRPGERAALPGGLLGERGFFNFNCVVLDVCRVTVGDFTLFGPAVQIYTATHPMNARRRRQQEFGKPLEVGSDVWVGGGASLCPGVRVGSRSVIGAGSVVTRDIPAGVFAAGNPCRVVREIAE
jgi:maltose O-acetyltransferase